MRLYGCVLTAGLFLGAIGTGCGGGANTNAKIAKNADGSAIKGVGNTPIAVAAVNKFNDALDAMVAHDKANDWNEATCADIAKRFEAAAAENPNHKFTEATYNAGLAYQRCGNDKEAKEHFQKALNEEQKFHYARSQLALYQFKGDTNLDAAISELDRVVTDASFQNAPALVNLSMFQMQRDAPRGGGENCKATGKDNREVELVDFECAKLNLQRALAIDDSYMPAFNQLALYYFNGARKRAAGSTKAAPARIGGRTMETNAGLSKKADVQQLELASLVCSQAIRKNPNYAPIHNTSGLILNELGLTNAAVTEFGEAARLDSHFFEARMNLAAINLSFRGFDKAQAAYQQALQMHPNDYDAHLGLALAIRGQIAEGGNYDAMVAQVQSELDAAKKIDAARPDAYYNEGILTDEYKSRGGSEGLKAIPIYEKAKTLFQDFVSKAQGKPEYDTAVKKAGERIKDIDQKIDTLKQIAAAAATPPPPPATSGAPASSASGAPAPTPPH